MKQPSKTQRIREFITAGWSNDEILAFVNTSRRYINQVRWLMNGPDRREYKRQWMANKRKSDPEYYRRELQKQRERHNA